MSREQSDDALGKKGIQPDQSLSDALVLAELVHTRLFTKGINRSVLPPMYRNVRDVEIRGLCVRDELNDRNAHTGCLIMAEKGSLFQPSRP